MVRVTKRFWAWTQRVGCARLLAAAEPPACPPGEDAALRAYVLIQAKLKATADDHEGLTAAVAKHPWMLAQSGAINSARLN